MINYREQISHGNNSYPIACYRLDPSHIRYQMAFHWHPEHEILYLKKGRLHLTLNQVEYDALPGDLFFLQGGTLHKGIASGDAEYYCIVFSPECMLPPEYAGHGIFTKLNNNSFQTDKFLGRDLPELSEIVLRIINEIDSSGEASMLRITGLLLQFMGILTDSRHCRAVSQPTTHSLKMLSAMRNVLYRIETEYANELTLADLAETANLSPNYFCRIFKKMTARSPIDYLISYRVSIAEYMLKSSDKSITETALSCGFNDVSHFIKYFKREKGITPKQYILSMKENG